MNPKTVLVESQQFENRTEPKCSYFGTCGGCAFQDLTYAAQLELKRKVAEEALSNFTTRDLFQIEPVIPSPKPYHYRHMLSLTVKRKGEALFLGFMERDGRTFLPIESCSIADDRINQSLPEARAKLEALPANKKFRTSQMTLRVGNGNVATSLPSDRGEKLKCTVLGKQFSYSVSSFFQNNYLILGSFVQTTRTFLRPKGEGTLFDLYSGVGLLGLSLADGYSRVIGIEEGFEAVQQAKQNAKRNEIRNATFLEGKVETLFPELTSVANEPLHVIVDPPRPGLKSEAIQCLLTLPIERLVYVSCELTALKRDLESLTKRFKITRVQPLDFFPQTKHIETVVLLEQR